MAASSASSDGSQQADMVSNENAETKFGTDGAETTMIKLVDGKLTPMGDTDDDVMDEQLRNRYTTDEERSLQGYTEKTYETSDASLRGAEDVKPDRLNNAEETTGTYVVEDNGPATQNDEMTYTLEEGTDQNQPATTAAASDGTPVSRVQPNGTDQTNTFSAAITGDMIPMTPGTPTPGFPETPPTPPTPPSPGPETPEFPITPPLTQPDIAEPSQPDRSHEINAASNQAGTSRYQSVFGQYGNGGATPTSSVSVDQNHVESTSDQVEPGQAVPGTQYVGMTAGIDDAEGMDTTPDTGTSARPYSVDANAPESYHPGERPEEAAEMQTQPRELTDESSVMAQDMINPNGERSDTKSTEEMDLPYNDPQSARNKTTY